MENKFKEGKVLLVKTAHGIGYDEVNQEYEITIEKVTDKRIKYNYRKRTTLLWGEKYDGSYNERKSGSSKLEVCISLPIPDRCFKIKDGKYNEVYVWEKHAEERGE